MTSRALFLLGGLAALAAVARQRLARKGQLPGASPRQKSSLASFPSASNLALSPRPQPPAAHPETQFQILVSVDRFKFTAAHFIAYEGFRERLHGHNYTISVRILGSNQVASDGYVIDFGVVKESVSQVCKRFNEHFIFPSLSPVLKVIERGDSVFRFLCIVDGSEFSFPSKDVLEVPIVHSSAEEIAEHMWHLLVNEAFAADVLESRGVRAIEVGVAEAPNQVAYFKRSLHSPEDHVVPCRNCAGCLSPLSVDLAL